MTSSADIQEACRSTIHKCQALSMWHKINQKQNYESCIIIIEMEILDFGEENQK